jgi:hypothetical protein
MVVKSRKNDDSVYLPMKYKYWNKERKNKRQGIASARPPVPVPPDSIGCNPFSFNT